MAAMAQNGPPSLASPVAARQKDTPASPVSPWARQARQFGFFLAGVGFMAASIAVTRRAVARRQAVWLPKFYDSNRKTIKVDGVEKNRIAADALGLATLNVTSFGIMLVGGIGWAFDLSTIDELRQRTQASLRRSTSLTNTPEQEKELEEMLESFLDKFGIKPDDLKEELKRDATSEKKD